MIASGRIGRNITAQLLSQVCIKVFNITVSLLTVRWLGPVRLGAYAYILAFGYPFGALADIGLGSLAIREISREPDREATVLTAVRRLYLVLALLSVTAMLGLAYGTHHDLRTILGIGLMGCTSLLTAITAPYLLGLTAREELHRLSFYQAVASVAGGVVTLGILLAGGGVTALLLGTVGTNAMLIFLARALAGAVGRRAGVPWSACMDLLRQAIPFGLVLVGFTVYYRLDVIMLRWFRGAEEVGRYAAAYRFLDAMLVLGAAVGAPLYPRLSSLMGRDRRAAHGLLTASWSLMLALGMPLVVGTTFVAGPLTVTLFGGRYQNAEPLVRLLVWAGLPSLLIAVPGHALNAADRVWYLAGVYWLSVVANLVSNLILIPSWGAEGASLATVLCAWLTLLLILRCLRRDLALAVSNKGLWRYLLAAAAMTAALWAVHGSNLALEIGTGITTYALALLLLGFWTSTDFRMVRELLTH